MKKRRISTTEEDLNRTVTVGILLQYTDDFLLPRIQDVVTDAITKNNAVLVHMLKDYVDKKNTQVKDDIFSRLERHGVLPKRV